MEKNPRPWIYKENEEFQHFAGMIDGLAFLPIDNIFQGVQYIDNNLPQIEGAEELLNNFLSVYMRGMPKRLNRDNMKNLILRMIPTKFLPRMMNEQTT